MIRWLLFILVYILLCLYTLQALRSGTRLPWVHYLYIAISLVVLGNFIYQFTWGEALVCKPDDIGFG